jgi:hypothetical protein
MTNKEYTIFMGEVVEDMSMDFMISVLYLQTSPSSTNINLLTLTHPLFYQIPDTASFFASMS